ncbi:MAG: LuxR C-terminal-related transcriptional regulator [Treponema sp.]|nr:LuxR C-terminal-related transcriptional regulator [Treponema sp.]
MEDRVFSIGELRKVINNMNTTYFMNDLWKIKDFVLELPYELVLKENLVPALVLIRILEGNLSEAENLIKKIQEADLPHAYFISHLLLMILPSIDDEVFVENMNELQKAGMKMQGLTFTAGRPSMSNGFRDFTGYNYMLATEKDTVLESLSTMYGAPSELMYQLIIAERQYQLNHCLEAMVSIVEIIPKVEKLGDIRLIFVAYYLRMQLLVVNGEVDSASKLVKEIKDTVSKYGNNELANNLDALEAKIAIYEGNFDVVEQWMANKAPDEHGDFCMLDLYRYFIKIRCYILTEKYMAGLVLSEKLRPLLKEGHRVMDLCEMDLLLSIGGYKANLLNDAFDALERALTIVKERQFYRLVADEGQAILKVLNAYRKARPKSEFIPFIYELVEMSRKTASFYPSYLVSPFKKQVALTYHEIEILHFLSRGLTYEEIAYNSNISINTVRYHIKKIYEKLEVNTASEAVRRADSLGLL